MRSLRIPILTYHSYRISGEAYDSNDHAALCSDLRTINSLGFRVVPLSWVVDWLLGARSERSLERAVAVTFDDGADFDFFDLEHPSWGMQRAFFNILIDVQREVGVTAQPNLHATSFVIASPNVRRELDSACLVGKGWMSDRWWAEAERSGIMAIHNHSWDHNHPMASRVCQRNQQKGSFEWIETEPECQAEVEQAARFIADKIRPSWPSLFAYPGGSSSEYIRETYFPWSMERHRTLAAFAADGGYVVRKTPRWNVPRFVFGCHWTDPNQLERILRDAA